MNLSRDEVVGLGMIGLALFCTGLGVGQIRPVADSQLYPAPMSGEVCYPSEVAQGWVCVSFREEQVCFRTAQGTECVPPLARPLKPSRSKVS